MTRHVDVLIVGAGVSGIGAAHHLKEQSPWADFVVLEAMESYGGTWLSNQYPGVRSDSDLFTYGFRFKPWKGAPIVEGGAIRDYLGEVIRDSALEPHIQYNQRILSAEWSSQDALWTVIAAVGEQGEISRFTATFLWMCQGYYRHREGHRPSWPGMEAFEGEIVHPQAWPADLDYSGKSVVVIGSGATAATIVPALAERAAHVTQLQRSPTYYVAAPNENPLVTQLRALGVDDDWIHVIARKQVLAEQEAILQRCFETPDAMRADLIAGVKAAVGPDVDVEAHFSPRYHPWRQRICFIPNSDLFEALKSGKASMVTDQIARFTPKGLELESGQILEADIVVTATGFNMNGFGDIDFRFDGAPLDLSKSVTYRGMMFTGVPNFAWIMGYFRWSWTLRVDVVADFVCRLLNHMRKERARAVAPELPVEERGALPRPYFDSNDLSSNYVGRAADLLPKSGAGPEWRLMQNYQFDKAETEAIDLDDSALVFEYGPAEGRRVG
jgi:cation diffusion facilitator CzcD-associated flavoprotein CzcO